MSRADGLVSLPPPLHAAASQKEEDEPGSISSPDDDDTPLLLLQNWLSHDSVDFHRFDDEEERQAVQKELLDWYRCHRRRLPWRGDWSPWTGSTALFATKNKVITGNEKKKQVERSGSFATKKVQSKLSAFIVAPGKNPSNDNEPQTKTRAATRTTLAVVKDGAETTEQKQQERRYAVTPYGIWVSEIMLQQTRVEAVVEYWCRWMNVFPTVTALAAATPEQVNAQWAGLGFYRRARLLHDAANLVVTQYDGVLPSTVDALLTLPGIGRYTASAIASVAFGVSDTPVVDGNVCRVLARLRAVSIPIKAPSFKDMHGWTIAESLVRDCGRRGGTNGDPDDAAAPGDLNQAMMELGATYCAPSGTGVDDDDPARGRYWSVELQRQVAVHRRRGGKIADLDALIPTGRSKTCPLCTSDGIRESLQLMWDAAVSGPTDNVNGLYGGHAGFPLAPPEAKKREEVLVVAVLRCKDRWLLTRRPEKGLLGGQWEFPNRCIWQSDGKQVSNKTTKVPEFAGSKRRKSLLELVRTITSGEDKNITWQQRLDAPVEHVFSHVRHTMWIECGEMTDAVDDDVGDGSNKDSGNAYTATRRWMGEQDMANVGVTSGVKKIMAAVLVTTKTGTGQSKKKRKRVVLPAK